jgi:hypothetical protein
LQIDSASSPYSHSPIRNLNLWALRDFIVEGQRPTEGDTEAKSALAVAPGGAVVLMKECWAADPARRPSGFEEIVDGLEIVLDAIRSSDTAIRSSDTASTRSDATNPTSHQKGKAKAARVSEGMDLGAGTRFSEDAGRDHSISHDTRKDSKFGSDTTTTEYFVNPMINAIGQAGDAGGEKEKTEQGPLKQGISHVRDGEAHREKSAKGGALGGPRIVSAVSAQRESSMCL